MKDRKRLGYLDSIRGIAAFIVVLSHCWLLNPESFRAAHRGLTAGLASPTDFFLFLLGKINEAGRSSVLLFYVLSGFVLAYSLQKNPLPYKAYALKRIFRIYPTFLFVILASYALHQTIGVRGFPFSEWLETTINPDLTLTSLIKHLTMWGTAGAHRLDNVMWTLVHEMRISLIFPFILLSIEKFKWRAVLLYWAFSIVCTLAILHVSGVVIEGNKEDNFARTFLDTGYFIIFFAGGALLALKHEWVGEKVAGMPRWTKALAFFMMTYCLLKSNYNNHFYFGSAVDYIRGIGAVGLIALALGSKKFGAFLNGGILAGLGRISYSLYLVHLPILYVLSQTAGTNWSVLQMSVALVVSSLIVAWGVAKLIEFPSIELGRIYARSVSAKMKR